MRQQTSDTAGGPLPPRSPKGGRPTLDIAARLGTHILDAAILQLIQRGVGRTSMDDIAAAANVSKRTLYARFGSKSDLVVSAIEHGVAKHLLPISSSIPDGPVRERLLHTAARMLDASLRPEAIGILAMVDWITGHQPELRAVVQKFSVDGPVAIIRTILEEGATRRELRVEDSDFTAMFVFDALVTTPRNNILFRRSLANDGRSRLAYLEYTISLILDGLRA